MTLYSLILQAQRTGWAQQLSQTINLGRQLRGSSICRRSREGSQAGGYLSSSEGTQRNSSGAGEGDVAFLLNRKTRYLVFFGGKTMHACLLPATVTAVTSIHRSFNSRSAPVLTKMVPQSHVASYTKCLQLQDAPRSQIQTGLGHSKSPTVSVMVDSISRITLE